jgi:hypothetical protein
MLVLKQRGRLRQCACHGNITGRPGEAGPSGRSLVLQFLSAAEGYIGPTLGASGAIELAAALHDGRCDLSTRTSIPSVQCRIHRDAPKKKTDRTVLKRFAFGINAALVCGKI